MWIEELHPENVHDGLLLDGVSKTVDHRFFVQESDHLQLWNAACQSGNNLKKYHNHMPVQARNVLPKSNGQVVDLLSDPLQVSVLDENKNNETSNDLNDFDIFSNQQEVGHPNASIVSPKPTNCRVETDHVAIKFDSFGENNSSNVESVSRSQAQDEDVFKDSVFPHQQPMKHDRNNLTTKSSIAGLSYATREQLVLDLGSEDISSQQASFAVSENCPSRETVGYDEDCENEFVVMGGTTGTGLKS